MLRLTAQEALRRLLREDWHVVPQRDFHRHFRRPTEMGFSVEVPDLPVCGTTGRTFEKAIRRAREAISLHLEALEEDGKAIPLPSARLEIRSDEPEEIVTFLAIQYWWAA